MDAPPKALDRWLDRAKRWPSSRGTASASWFRSAQSDALHRRGRASQQALRLPVQGRPATEVPIGADAPEVARADNWGSQAVMDRTAVSLVSSQCGPGSTGKDTRSP